MSSNILIAVEEHWLSADIPSTTTPTSPALDILPPSATTKLRTLGMPRLREMRTSASSTQQIISHLPIDAAPKLCSKINDTLASSIVANQDRFKALALLPSWDGKEAAAELQRCVTKYKFVGGVVGVKRGMGLGSGVEGEAWEEVWKVAGMYNVPVAIRVLFPTRDQLSEYDGQYPGQVPQPIVAGLAASFYGVISTSPLLVLRLYLNGVFDRHPHLRLVLSQYGHGIPALLPRVNSFLAPLPAALKPTRNFLDVWQHNFYITLADTLDMASTRALLEQIPIDRVLYAGGEKGREFMAELRNSGIVGKEEYERIAFRNAESLFVLGKAVVRPGFRKQASFG